MPKRTPEDQRLSMKAIQGSSKMCCFSSETFRNEVLAIAKLRHTKLQEFILEAVRDKVREHHGEARSIEGRRMIALSALLHDRKAPAVVKDLVTQALEPYMPNL